MGELINAHWVPNARQVFQSDRILRINNEDVTMRTQEQAAVLIASKAFATVRKMRERPQS